MRLKSKATPLMNQNAKRKPQNRIQSVTQQIRNTQDPVEQERLRQLLHHLMITHNASDKAKPTATKK